MANLQSRIILSSLVFVFVALSACSKHGARNQIIDDKKAPATSTAADPAKAVADNKKADDAAKAAAALAAKSGEKSPVDPAEAGAAAADRGDALDKAVSLFADKKTPAVDAGAAAPSADIATATVVAATAAATTAQALVQATVKPIVGDDAKMIATGTLTSAEATEIAKPIVTADTAIPISATPEKTPSTSTDPIQLQPVIVTGAARATRLAFVKAMIQPTIELNNAIARQQIVIAGLQKKAVDKRLTDSETETLMHLRKVYALSGSATFEDLLARVDMVSMPVLVAKFAIESNWKADSVTMKMLGERVKFLNTDSSPEAIMFRAARIAVKAHDVQYRSWAIMKGVQHRSSDPDTLPEVVLDINQLAQDPSVVQEVARARAELEAQNLKAVGL